MDKDPEMGKPLVSSGARRYLRHSTPEVRRRVVTDEEIENWFAYHTPREYQIQLYTRLRDQGRRMALLIRNSCPPGPDATAAIRKVREAVMTANQAIACYDPD